MCTSPLNGSVVWLTGAGAGIGRSLALLLAESGCRLGITSRSELDLQKLADQIAEQGHCKPLVLPADVTISSELRSAHKQLCDYFGPVDILIANAGIYEPEGSFDLTADRASTVMDVNYSGMVRCVELVLPDMRDAGSGQIVGVSSLVAYRGLPRAAAYCASKAAMTTFLESLRFDVETAGIGVQVVSPGFVKTRLTEKNAFPMPFRISAEQAAKYILKGILRKRREIFFPLRFALPMKLLRILPYQIYHRIIRRGVMR